jgi:hypothetical protein
MYIFKTTVAWPHSLPCIFALLRCIAHKVCTECSRTGYKIVSLTNVNKYLHNDTSETEVNVYTCVNGGSDREHPCSAELMITWINAQLPHYTFLQRTYHHTWQGHDTFSIICYYIIYICSIIFILYICNIVYNLC